MPGGGALLDAPVTGATSGVFGTTRTLGRRTTLAALSFLLAAALLLAALAAPAQAKEIRKFGGSFDGNGTPDGSFSGPGRMATDQDDDLLYVLDPGNDVLLKYDVSDPINPTLANFSAQGSPAIDGAATPQGALELTADADVAVDNSGTATDGQIYVATGGSNGTGGRVDVFDVTGNYLFQFDSSPTGVAVDHSGHVYTGHPFAFFTTDHVEKYDVTPTAATRDASFTITNADPTDGGARLAVDSSGTIYLSYAFFGRTGISKYDPSGAFQRRITTNVVTDVAVNPLNDHVYVDTGTGITERAADGATVLDKFGSTQLSSSDGVAVDPATGTVYASDSTSHEVSIFRMVVVPEARIGPALDDTGTSATLTGTINPDGVSLSDCEFQWGTTRGLSEVPIPCQPNPGASAGPVEVTAPLSGLTPGTTYYYRLHVANANGVADTGQRRFLAGECPNAPRSRLSSALPACRAYEKVSPADKNGADVLHESMRFAARDGGAFVYNSDGAFADPVGASTRSSYYARRSPGGWQNTNITLPTSPAVRSDVIFDAFTPDAKTGVLRASNTAGIDIAPFTMNVLHRSFDGTLELLSPGQPTPALTGNPEIPFVRGVSETLSLVAYALSGPGLPVSSGPEAVDGVINMYAAARGELQLVSVLPNDTAAPNGGNSRGANPVSDDGSRIVWRALPPADQEIYIRIDATTDHATTEWASESERSAPDPAGVQPKRFEYATPDGDLVYFTSEEKLTDDALASAGNPDLYRYEVATGDLIDLTTDGANGGGALGVLGTSDDGARVYFAATGKLTSDATGADPKVYLSEGTNLTLVADLAGGSSSSDSGNWTDSADPDLKLSRVTADGRYLLFSSGRRQGDFENAGFAQLYLYDASSGETDCVSCDPSGDAPTGAAQVASTVVHQTRSLMPDGTVFFSSPDRLVAKDTNGRYDAYAWDGGPSLLSTGQSSDDSFFFDASAEGRDVFFTTRQRLVGIDADDQVDVYDARIGGGIRSQNPAPPPEPCSGEGCQPPPSEPPSAPQVSTTGFGGAGAGDNPNSKRRCLRLDGKHDRAKQKQRELKRKSRRLERRSTKLRQRSKNSPNARAQRFRKRARKQARRADRMHERAKRQRLKVRKARRRARKLGCEPSRANRDGRRSGPRERGRGR